MIDREHWLLWARWRAEGDGLYTGYRATNVLYTPPRRLPEDDDAPMFEMPTDEDYRRVQLIESALRALSRNYESDMQYLIEWFGAYPGAPSQRGQRILRMGLNPREAHRVVERLQTYVTGWIHGHESREIE